MLRTSLLTACCFFTPALSAQIAYGTGTPGTGGIVPTLSCPQAWLGRTGFELTVDDALGGSVAVVAVSEFASSVAVPGMTVLIDPTHLASTLLVALGGTTGVAGDGSGALSIDLSGLPATPALAGTQLFFQAFVLDPNGTGLGGLLSASNGLDLALTMPPELFVATGGGNYFRFDPSGATAPIADSQPDLNVVNGIQYSRAGLELLATTGFGDVLHADLSVTPPVWTTALGTLNTSTVAWNNLAYLEDLKLGWVGSRGNGSAMELLLVSLDPTAATFGQVVSQTNGLQNAIGPFGAWALSPDGTRIAAASPWNGSIAIIDADLASPTSLQILTVAAIPSSVSAPGFTVNNYISWAPDGSRFWLARQNQGTAPGEIACYDLATGWVDHDPSTFLIDHIGATSNPPVSLPAGLRCVLVSKQGDALFTAGSVFGNGYMCRIDIATLQRTLPNGTTATNDESLLALDRDGARVAVAADGVVVLYDTATMTEIGSFAVTPGSIEKDMAFR